MWKYWRMKIMIIIQKRFSPHCVKLCIYFFMIHNFFKVFSYNFSFFTSLLPSWSIMFESYFYHQNLMNYEFSFILMWPTLNIPHNITEIISFYQILRLENMRRAAVFYFLSRRSGSWQCLTFLKLNSFWLTNFVFLQLWDRFHTLQAWNWKLISD